MRPITLLRPAQHSTIAELRDSTGVQAVLGMGAGKTVCALTAIRDLIDRGTIDEAFVLAPKRVADNTWPAEIRAWEHLAGTALVSLHSGQPPARRARLLDTGGYEIYVAAINLAEWLCQQLTPERMARAVLIIDEISLLKDASSKRSKLLRRVAPAFNAVWGLTGTPRPNDLQDVWSQLQVVSAGEAFDRSFHRWRRANFYPLDYRGYRWSVLPGRKDAVMRTVHEWSFTVPRNEETDTPFNAGDDHDIFVDLLPEQEKDLETLFKELVAETGISPSAADILNGVLDEDLIVALTSGVASGKMAQALQGFIYRDGKVAKRYPRNPKLEALRDTLEGLVEDPTIVVYHFREDLRLIDDLHRSLHAKPVPYLGAGVKAADAAAHIDAWNAGDLPVLAIHPASAGHGLNLQHGGRRLIWFTPTWSAELYAQTCKRLARPGQQWPVFSHRIRGRHWYEDMRVARVEGKLREQDAHIQSLDVIGEDQ